MPETEVEEQAGTSSTADSGSQDQDIDTEALDLIGQGKRNLVVGDPPAAVQCLQEACALLAAKYGETADECGEVYYQYGCALFDLASMENGVLGNALQGVPDESADSDDDDDKSEEKPSTTNVESADNLEDEDDCAGPSTETDEGAGPSTEPGPSTEGAGPSTEPGPSTEGAGPSTEPDTTLGEDDKEDGDDVSNFQLAWEMLELARVIIGRQESKDCQLKVSQIHLKLGELGLETEQYVQSIVDFGNCLELQKKYLNPESRLIAGTHYNLGLAYSFDQKFDDSIENYKLSKQLIEQRLANLEKIVSETEGKGKEKADEKDPLISNQKEIDELKDLLPDIVSKLDDAKDMKLQGGVGDGAGPSSSTSSGFAASSSGFAPSSSGFAAPSSSGFAASSSSEPVQQIAVKKAGNACDISHLVRRKRKPEECEDDAATATDTKRSRQEDGDKKSMPAVNGAGDATIANGASHMNGDVMNGDGEISSEKPSEIKAKTIASDGDAPAAMETA